MFKTNKTHYNIQSFANFQTLLREAQKNTGFILPHNQLQLWSFTDNQIIAALKQVNKQQTHSLNINRKSYNLS